MTKASFSCRIFMRRGKGTNDPAFCEFLEHQEHRMREETLNRMTTGPGNLREEKKSGKTER